MAERNRLFSPILTAVVAALAFWLIKPGIVCGQPLAIDMTSVEWLAGDSTHVAIGTIIKYEVIPNSRYHEVTVRLSETLKGEAADEIKFVHQHGFSHYDIPALIRDEQRFVFFFKYWFETRDYNIDHRQRHFARYPFCLHSFISLEPMKVRLNSQSMPPVVTSDLRHLENSADIGEAIKTYLAKREPDSMLVPVKTELPSDYNFGGILGSLLGPADSARPKHAPAGRSVERIKDFAKFKKEHGNMRPAKVFQYSGQRWKDSRHGARIDSIEWMFDDCNAVVVASIKDFCFRRIIHDSLGLHGDYAVQLEIQKVFKGSINTKTLTVFLPYQVDLEPLTKSAGNFLFFLRRTDYARVPTNARNSLPISIADYSDYQKQFDFTVRDTCWDNSIIHLKKDQSHALFGDFTWHQDPEEILAYCEKLSAAAWKTVPLQSTWLEFEDSCPLPMQLRVGKGLTRNSCVANADKVYFQVPVDHHLERNARRWMESNDPDRRLAGVRAMLYFRSDENAELLKSMLDDDARWRWHYAADWCSGEASRTVPNHLIRWEAWKILEAWGVLCDQPDFGRAVFEKK